MNEPHDKALIDAAGVDLVVRPRWRSVDQGGMDITPMIDITFLLLIFFLVAGRLQQNTPAELPAARYGDGVDPKVAAVLTLVRGPGEQDLVFQGDSIAPSQQIDAPDLGQQQLQIAAYVERQMAGQPPQEMPKQHVLIKAARDVRSREVARVARAVGKAATAGDIPLYVAVREGDE